MQKELARIAITVVLTAAVMSLPPDVVALILAIGAGSAVVLMLAFGK